MSMNRFTISSTDVFSSSRSISRRDGVLAKATYKLILDFLEGDFFAVQRYGEFASLAAGFLKK